jgi:hypothetical protein
MFGFPGSSYTAITTMQIEPLEIYDTGKQPMWVLGVEL